MFCLIILLINIIVWTFAACPTGQIPSISDPTICYSFEKIKTNWFAAMQNCKEKDGTLISLHNMFENMFINGEAKSIFTESTNSDFWIGGIYNGLSQGKWSWIDNSTFDFTDWDKGQPQNTTDSLCAISIMNGAKWQSTDCFIDKLFVCEIKLVSTTTTTTAVVTTSKRLPITTKTYATTTPKKKICPDSWIYFNATNYCYKAFKNYSNWNDAEAACIKEGAHLASIHSYSENLFIASIASNNDSNTCGWWFQSWIGLSRNSGSYQWTDGTPYDYTSWISGTPPSDTKFNCTITWIGQTCYGNGWNSGATDWNNGICNGKALNHVCKKAQIS